jgi:hypothetical protein
VQDRAPASAEAAAGPPCLGCQIGADLKAGDLEPALRERNGRLTGRAANLQQPVTGPQPRQPH